MMKQKIVIAGALELWSVDELLRYVREGKVD